MLGLLVGVAAEKTRRVTEPTTRLSLQVNVVAASNKAISCFSVARPNPLGDSFGGSCEGM
jgi:hypothetical protein